MFEINKYANKIYLEDVLYRHITLEDLLEVRYNVFHGSSSKIKAYFFNTSKIRIGNKTENSNYL